MEMMAPSGPVYQAGTLSGNPLAMTAGIETIKALKNQDVYDKLEHLASILERGLRTASEETNVNIYISRIASLLTIFFTGNPVIDYETAKNADITLFNRFFHGLLSEGIYWPPSQFEASFISLAHTEEDIHTTVQTVKKVFGSL
jgi:glutamate-1-semialdehyde 2,1-aminomutase